MTVTNVFDNHYAYGYSIGAAATDCPSGYNIPSGQYSSTYHLERGHAIHHYDPKTPANDYWVYWAHFDNSSYGTAEVAVFKSTTECGPYVLQTNLYTGSTGSSVTDPGAAYNADGVGYGFRPGGWQSRDEIVYTDTATQTYNGDGTVASYANSYLYTASNSLNTAPTSSGSTCSYANDSIAAFRMTPDYLGIDQTTSPNTSGANWIFPCTQREAPVMFRSGSYYFLIVSQAAGWYPSQGAYGSSANPLTGFPGSPLNLGNTSTFGGQTSDGFQISGTQATSYILSFDHLGGDDSKNPSYTGSRRDSGTVYLPVVLNGTTGAATLSWEPSFTINNTTGVLTLPTLNNLATSGTATATTYTGTSNPTSYAIDGNYTTRWAAAASSGTSTLETGSATFSAATSKTSTLCPVTGATSSTTCNPSLVVDLGSVQPIQELDLSWYMIKGSEPYYSFKVEYSSDKSTWTTLDYTAYASGSNTTAANISAVPFSTDVTYGFNSLPVNFSARYVAITETAETVQNNSPGNYGPNLYELAVMQSTAPTTPTPATVTVTPSTTSPATDSSFTVGVTVTGPNGSSVPTGYIQLSAPGFTSDTYGLVAGANTFTIPAGALSGGAETITVSYRADPTSAPIYGIGTTTGTASVNVSVPDAPTGVAVSQSQPNALTVTWNASVGSSSYILYRSLDGGSSYTQLATPTATTYLDTGLTNGNNYCYEVAAVNNGGTSSLSAAACNTASGNFPVTNISVTQNGTAQLTITYTAVTNATGYTINRSVAGGAYSTLTTTTSTTYTDTGLTNGTNYCYTIAAVFSTGTASASSPVCATVSASITTVTINGFSFESPSTTTYAYNPAVSGTTQPWIFTASGTAIGSGVTTNGSGFTASNSNAPNGTQVAFLQGQGVVYQTVTGLTPGTTYRITEAASQRANKSGGQLGNPYEVRVDGTAIATVMATQGVTTYTDFTQYFTATKSSHIIGFYGTNANANTTYPDNTVFIDNVRMISYPAAASTSSTPNYIWILNNTGTVTRTDEQGSPQNSALGTTNAGSSYGGIAVDSNGGVWSVASGNNLVNYVANASAANASSYSATTFSNSSLNMPSSIAIDGAGTVWIANYAGNAISAFTSAGALSGTVADASFQGAIGIAVDPSGNVWVANATGNTVDEIVGGAAPAAPLATAVTSNSPGAKP